LPKSAQLQKLTSPAEMGELFKVIALGKPGPHSVSEPDMHGEGKGMPGRLCGFSHGDLTRLL
jgi:hypothetical protein